MNHDMDAVERFINAAWNREPADLGDAESAALLLMDLLQNSREARKIAGVTRGRGPKHDMSGIYMSHPLFAIAMRVARGEMRRAEAVEHFCQHFDDIDERTAETYLDQLMPRAARTAKVLDALQARAAQDTK